jgi:enterochelin esterase-like enzyme
VASLVKANQTFTWGYKLSIEMWALETLAEHLHSGRSISLFRLRPAVNANTMKVVVCFDGQALPVLLSGALRVLKEMTIAESDAQLHGGLDDTVCRFLEDSRMAATDWLFVGVDSSDDHRKAEYVQGVDAERYEEHRAFVFDRVLPWIESELSRPLDRKHTALFGCSFGGVAALQLGFLQPEKIGAVLAFSPVGLPSDWIVPVPSDCPLPLVYLLAGSREGSSGLWKLVKKTERKLQKAGAVTESKLVGGGTHSYSMWGPELAHALLWWQRGVALDEGRG